MRAIPAREVPPRLWTIDPDDAATAARYGALFINLTRDDQERAAILVQLARCSLGMTQTELGRHVGMSRTAVGRLEAQRTRIRPKRAALLAATLDLPADLLETA